MKLHDNYNKNLMQWIFGISSANGVKYSQVFLIILIKLSKLKMDVSFNV